MKLSNQNLNSALKLAAIGGLTAASNQTFNALKPIVSQFITNKFSYKLVCGNTRYQDYFVALTKYLRTNFTIFDNMVNFNREWYMSNDANKYMGEIKIPDGKYTSRKNGCIYSIEVSTQKDNSNDTTITVNIYGRNAKSEFKQLVKTLLKVYDNNDSRFIVTEISSNNEYNYSYDKYDINNIFSNKKQEIVDIIDKFEVEKSIFEKYQIKHKVGILLYGEPGTGKTSIAKAIASYLGFRLIIIKANSITPSIINTMNGCNNVVILFEDIDCTIGTRDRHNETKEKIKTKEKIELKDDKNDAFASLHKAMEFDAIGDLLNLLDGINSPDNVIFIGTTNHKDKLDPALLRHSRFDHIIEMGEIDKSIAIEMCNHFEVPSELLLKDMKDDETINPSTLQFDILQYKRKFI